MDAGLWACCPCLASGSTSSWNEPNEQIRTSSWNVIGDRLETGYVEGLQVFRTKSGRWGSNPRRAAWENGRRPRLKDLRTFQSSMLPKNWPIFRISPFPASLLELSRNRNQRTPTSASLYKGSVEFDSIRHRRQTSRSF